MKTLYRSCSTILICRDCCLKKVCIYTIFSSGILSRWVVYDEVTEVPVSFIQSKKEDLVFPPETGWEYYDWDDENWHEAFSLTVTGKPIDLGSKFGLIFSMMRRSIAS